jgi:D-serine dehydratase
MDLGEIHNTILDRRTKGIPGSVEPFPLKEIKNKKWNILSEDMPMPLMVLKQKKLYS